MDARTIIEAVAAETGAGAEVGTPGAAVAGADATGTSYEAATLAAALPPAADTSAVGTESALVSIVMSAADSATLEEAWEVEAAPEAHPPEEAFGYEEGGVEAYLSAADATGRGVDNAAWLPHGAYTVPVPLSDTVLDKEFEILGR